MSATPIAATSADFALLERVRARDVGALEALYDAHSPYVMGVALKLLGSRDDAEEVVQDVFWKLWHRDLQYDPARARFRTWLYVIARNEALDHLRKRRRRNQRPADALPLAVDVEPENPDYQIDLAAKRRELTAALADLTGPEREALLLAFFQGCSHSEVAARTGEPLGTFKGRIRRAVEKLRDALQQGGSPA